MWTRIVFAEMARYNIGMDFEELDVKQVEVELTDLIKKLKIGDKISVAWIKDFTYNFDAPDNQIAQKYFGALFDLLPKNISEKDFETAVRVFNNAWNAFPQKIMGGISPQEKMLGANSLEEHFAVAKKDLDKYLDWAGKEVLPNYKKSLENLKLDKIKKRNAVGVAEVLFQICGQLGMLDFRRLPPDFIKDFPEIFKKEVVGPKISQEKVAEYLGNFLAFLDLFYGIKAVD